MDKVPFKSEIGDEVVVIDIDGNVVAEGVITDLAKSQYRMSAKIGEEEFQFCTWDRNQPVMISKAKAQELVGSRPLVDYCDVVDKKLKYTVDGLDDADKAVVLEKLKELDVLLSSKMERKSGISYEAYQSLHGNQSLSYEDCITGRLKDVFERISRGSYGDLSL